MSDQILRRRVVAFGVVLLVSAAVGLNGPLWAAMPWAATP